MLHRSLASRLRQLLRDFPAVALLGPRQSGKTTLANELAAALGPKRAIYLDLELPSDRVKLSDPEAYLAAHERRLVIADEVQRIPELFGPLRGIIDRRKRKGIHHGQFLFLGSASIELLKQASESLAGRLATVELSPLNLLETAKGKLEALWVRGGFPNSFLARSEQASLAWRQAFIRTYLERDIPSLGPRIPAETLRRFWEMLAHNQGQLLNAQRLAASLGVSGQTVGRYLDLMVDLLLVRRLHPWESNAGKRLVRSPKVYVRDSGIVHALLRIEDREALLGHPVAGPSWEGMVIENILAVAEFPRRQAYFYRSAQGAEVDLVLELSSKERWAIEVKRSLANPQPGKGFHIGCEDVKATRRLIVYPGQERFPIANRTTVTPLADLLAEL